MTGAPLRRTVRRCTALLLLQLAVVSAQLYEAFGGGGSTITTYTTLPLAGGAFCYLAVSLLYGLAAPEASTETTA